MGGIRKYVGIIVHSRTHCKFSLRKRGGRVVCRGIFPPHARRNPRTFPEFPRRSFGTPLRKRVFSHLADGVLESVSSPFRLGKPGVFRLCRNNWQSRSGGIFRTPFRGAWTNGTVLRMRAVFRRFDRFLRHKNSRSLQVFPNASRPCRFLWSTFRSM